MRRLGAAVMVAAALGGAQVPPAAEAPKPTVVEVESFTDAYVWCEEHYGSESNAFPTEAYMRCMNAAYRAFGYVEPYRFA